MDKAGGRYGHTRIFIHKDDLHKGLEKTTNWIDAMFKMIFTMMVEQIKPFEQVN